MPGFTLRNNAPTFSVTFIFVGRLLDSLASLSLGLGNSACPSILPGSWPSFFSFVFPRSVVFPPSCRCEPARVHAAALCPSFWGPSRHFRPTPAILERVSYQRATRMKPLRSLENADPTRGSTAAGQTDGSNRNTARPRLTLNVPKEPSPWCDTCNRRFTVKHVVIECTEMGTHRGRTKVSNQIRQIFETS